ncbi:MAG: glycoside hydrolase family 2 TIM barrel-domain containing protein [Myxococcota bacterium]|nr:glycoside hydrolase family 2 TIM barrel-domain containing protein [Myxococcota bacterium]
MSLWFGAFFFLLGAGALSLTVYLWIGDWPTRTKEVVDHYRSLAENAGAPPSPLVANVYGRRNHSLGGTWSAVVDPYRRGDLGGMAARALEPGSPSDLSEFSFENGLELEVPGDWTTQDPRLYFYQGVVWYKTDFEHEADSGSRTFLWIGAANYRSSVFLNGLLIAEHEGGFTPFNVEITNQLKSGSNLLVVRVDSEMGDDDVPTSMTDWHNYGGITRDVLLIDLPPIFIQDYTLRLSEEDAGLIKGWVQLDGNRSPQSIRVRIPELEIDLEMVSDEKGRVEFEFPASPELWSPDSPRLYEVEISSAMDTIRDEIGFRTISIEGDEIRLNGESIFLRGISLHEEAPDDTRGRAFSVEDAEILLGWVRDLGGNFARLAHYPHSQHMARVADRLGILLWEEIPVYWNIDFENPQTLKRAKRQLTELITRDRNRASVVLWSIGNETAFSQARQDFMTALAEHVRGLDESRLVTAALITDPQDMQAFFLGSYLPALLGFPDRSWEYRLTDPLAEVVDVQALNQYFGWYYSGFLGLVGPFSSHHARRVMLENMPRIRFRSDIGKPLIVSETGAGALLGLRAPEEDLVTFSEDYQALVYRKQIEMLSEQESLAGVSPWILKDFRSPLRLYQGVQDYWNLKGLVAGDGTKKTAFFVLRDWYRDRSNQPDAS